LEQKSNKYRQNLLSCDLDPYDERWFLPASEAADLLRVVVWASSSTQEGTGVTPSRVERPPCERNESVFSILSTSNSTLSNLTTGSSSHSSTGSVSTATSYPDITTKPSHLLVLDLRPSVAFEASHIRSARNVPLPETQPDFYESAAAVERRWGELSQALDDDVVAIGPYGGCSPLDKEAAIIVLCCDGDSGRMATSILRGKGHQAFCVDGGYAQLEKELGRTGASDLIVT
jgi:rhodanese-related sulfurtransferase